MLPMLILEMSYLCSSIAYNFYFVNCKYCIIKSRGKGKGGLLLDLIRFVKDLDFLFFSILYLFALCCSFIIMNFNLKINKDIIIVIIIITVVIVVAFVVVVVVVVDDVVVILQVT